MVDTIGSGGGVAGASLIAEARVAAISRTTPIAAATPVATPAPADTPSAVPQLAALAKSLAASAPVDTDRVQQIKQALANGTFPILPATIADQMMAFRYEWMSHDPSFHDQA